MPRSINHTGTPYKYQLDFLLQKAELVLSNPLGKLSLVLRINNQRFETLQRPKALKEVLLNETLQTTTTLYETQANLYEEAIVHIDLFLNQTRSSKIIGVVDLDITAMANEANQGENQQEFVLIMDKSPEYKAKISLKIQMKFIGLEIAEKNNMLKKRGHSNLPQKNFEIEENKSDVSTEEINEAFRQKTIK